MGFGLQMATVCQFLKDKFPLHTQSTIFILQKLTHCTNCHWGTANTPLREKRAWLLASLHLRVPIRMVQGSSR